jgi:hypothetical protein
MKYADDLVQLAKEKTALQGTTDRLVEVGEETMEWKRTRKNLR